MTNLREERKNEILNLINQNKRINMNLLISLLSIRWGYSHKTIEEYLWNY